VNVQVDGETWQKEESERWSECIRDGGRERSRAAVTVHEHVT
jgi:hypothetical protein